MVMVGFGLVACKIGPDPGAGPMGPGPMGPAPQQAQVGGSWSCVDLMTCYGKCPGLNPDCTSACDPNGTPAAQAANGEVFRCIAQSGCQDEPCISSTCAAQLQACVNTPGGTVATAPPPEDPDPGPGPASAPPASAAVPDSDFILHTDNGDFVPELVVVAQGVPVALEGTWQDSRRNFVLELHGGSYTASDQGSGPSGSAHTTETGTWSLSGTTLTVTPTAAHLNTLDRIHETSQATAPDAPRTWTLVGATLQYVKFGDPNRTVHRVDGLLLGGTAPSWDPVGQFAHTLRRAR